MTRYTKGTRQPTGAVKSEGTTTRTAQGGTGHLRDPKSELFLLGVTNLVSQETFYESSKVRDSRFTELIHRVTKAEPAWVQGFLPWLRTEANMRTAPLVGAIEYALAGGPQPRQLLNAVLRRPDEPAEAVGYWMLRTKRHTIPGGVQRGIADAVTRMYNEKAALRWDSQKNNIRMGDVLELTHAKPSAQWQDALFNYLLTIRHKGRNETAISEDLPMLSKNRELEELDTQSRKDILNTSTANTFKSAGFSWEQLLSWAPSDVDRNIVWSIAVELMGYMAVLRNLRNFEQNITNTDLLEVVESRLTNPEEVSRSQQLPIRFINAWKEVGDMRWAKPLDTAMKLSLENVPKMDGRTLVLIDASASMEDKMSKRSKAQRWEIAAGFGASVANAGKSDVFAFSSAGGGLFGGRNRTSNSPVHKLSKTNSPLRLRDEIEKCPIAFGGTQTFESLKQTYDPDRHDRVVIITDEQSHDSPRRMTMKAPVYTFNVSGYRAAHGPTSGYDGWYTFGGLSDSGLDAISALESRKDQGWPFPIPEM